MPRFLIFLSFLLLLNACGHPQENTASPAASSASTPSEHANIASAVLNVPQGEDILQSSKQAMRNINASDIAAASKATFTPEMLPIQETVSASELAQLPPLPAACQQYFQRAQSCYQAQAQAEGLVNLLQQQQIDLANDKPDETSCQQLAHSFDAVAQNLGCR